MGGSLPVKEKPLPRPRETATLPLLDARECDKPPWPFLLRLPLGPFPKEDSLGAEFTGAPSTAGDERWELAAMALRAVTVNPARRSLVAAIAGSAAVGVFTTWAAVTGAFTVGATATWVLAVDALKTEGGTAEVAAGAATAGAAPDGVAEADAKGADFAETAATGVSVGVTTGSDPGEFFLIGQLVPWPNE